MSTSQKTQAEQTDLLRVRIAQSELSARRFAVDVLHRDERTMRRWLSGESPIPAVVLDWLEYPERAPWPL